MDKWRSFRVPITDSDAAVAAFHHTMPLARIRDIEVDVYGQQTFIYYEPSQVEKWDWRFLAMAEFVASWSKDPSTKCGAVIVRPDRSIVSTGYNGFPRGCEDKEEHYANHEEKYQRVIHAEVNAVLQARVDLRGCVLYSWPPGLAPTCDRCATVVIQSGIARVVYVRADNEFTRRWSPDRSLELYREAGVEVTAYEP